MRIAFFLLSSLAVYAQSASNFGVDQIFKDWAKPDSPGCSVSVMNGGRIVYKRGYGMADLDHNLPNSPSSVFHVASISKQFTAASILLLAEDGKLSLDDPIRKHLPEVVPDFGTPITVRQLIHHTSGLRDQWAFLDLGGWRYNDDLITDDDVMSFVTRQKALNFKPGEMYMYSNTGYTLLGQIVKRVSGKSLREFTTERLFKPLGMTSTHFRDRHAEIVKGMSYGYVRNAKGDWEFSIPNFDTVGATSLLTTAEDLAKWDENFFQEWARNGLTEKMLKRGELNSGEVIPYAFALQHGKYRSLTTVEHGGADAGYRAGLLRFPEQHFTVALLCNVAPIDTSLLTRKVAEVFLGGLMEAAPVKLIPAILSEDAQKAFTGMYWNAEELILREVVWENNKLRYRSNGAPAEDLEPRSDTTFHTLRSDIDIEFVKGKLTEVRPNRRVELVATPRATPRAARLRDFAGTYRLEEMETEWRLVMKEGNLMATRLRFAPVKIEPQVAEVFSLQGLGLVQFTRGKDGKVDGFVLNGGRVRNVRFLRVKETR